MLASGHCSPLTAQNFVLNGRKCELIKTFFVSRFKFSFAIEPNFSINLQIINNSLFLITGFYELVLDQITSVTPSSPCWSNEIETYLAANQNCQTWAWLVWSQSNSDSLKSCHDWLKTDRWLQLKWLHYNKDFLFSFFTQIYKCSAMICTSCIFCFQELLSLACSSLDWTCVCWMGAAVPLGRSTFI